MLYMTLGDQHASPALKVGLIREPHRPQMPDTAWSRSGQSTIPTVPQGGTPSRRMGAVGRASLRSGRADNQYSDDGMAPHVGGYVFDGRTRRSHAPRRYRIADRCRPPSDEDNRHPGSRAGSVDGVRGTIK
jgi:hypothetical protein